MFGLGTELDKVFGSKWLLTELNKLGFSITSNETTRYKQSVVCNENINDYLNNVMNGSFSQCSADNVDHNIASIDGKGSLHAMGIIVSSSSSIPKINLSELPPVVRQKLKLANEVIEGKAIPIVPYNPPGELGLSLINLKPITDLVWHAKRFVTNSCPSWSGYMSNITSGTYPGKATISMLPIINLNPNDMTCIFSTLRFIVEQARLLHITTPVITFDQPLWLKASEIVAANSMNIVIILGGFHLMMSFLGSVGEVMKGSGIGEALETVYGKNTVLQIMSGKAVTRAIRGHFLMESVLMNKLISKLDDFQQDESNAAKEQIAEFLTEIEEVLRHSPEEGLNKLEESDILNRLSTLLDRLQQSLSESSRTATLWIQYLQYICILKRFIRAERSGNWNYPWVYENFAIHGYHTVRRSDKYWSGLWTDLITEQVMMRSLKTSGGLTRGRGISESVRQL